MLSGIINLVHIYFLFFLLAPKMFSEDQHTDIGLLFSVWGHSIGNLISSEPWMKFRPLGINVIDFSDIPYMWTAINALSVGDDPTLP